MTSAVEGNRQEDACFWIAETNPLLTRGWNHLHHKRAPQLLSSSAIWHLTPDPQPLGGAVAVYTVAHWLQPAIETDEMWLQLQTDLKEAIESVWTVIGYPAHCRGTRCHNEMHLFIFSPSLPWEDDWGHASIDSPCTLNLLRPARFT